MDLDLVVGRDKAVHLIRCPQSFSPVLKLFFLSAFIFLLWRGFSGVVVADICASGMV